MNEKAAGNTGRIRVGCKCKAHLDEDCKCEGVIRFTLSKWEVEFGKDELRDFPPWQRMPDEAINQ